jgi:hypothetical protein
MLKAIEVRLRGPSSHSLDLPLAIETFRLFWCYIGQKKRRAGNAGESIEAPLYRFGW